MKAFKTLTSITGKIIGEAFETDKGFSFFHHPTETTKSGFDTIEQAYDGLWVFHEDYFEGL